MFKRTLTAAFAALALASASLSIAQPAQAGVGSLLVAGAVGAVVGGALASRPAAPSYQPSYGGCGYRNSPVFDAYGNRIGFQRLPAC